jgi:RNA polymerase sigma-70 factor, ECF subfamily
VSPEPSDLASSGLTALLGAWRAGDERAGATVLGLVQPRLEAMARRALRGERRGFTLQTGDLVNEAFLRLSAGADVDWRDRAHFFALSARLLRRIVIDHCRRRRRLKRGDGAPCVPLDAALDAAAPAGLDAASLLALDDALGELERVDALAARVVELRFFAELDYDGIAEVLAISRATAFRHWRFARAFLHARLA